MTPDLSPAAPLLAYLEDANELVFWTTADGQVTGGNRAWRDATGYSPTPSTPIPLATLLPHTPAPDLTHPETDPNPSPSRLPLQLELHTATGATLRLEGTFTPGSRFGQPGLAIGTFHDVTHRDARDAELRKLALIASLTDNAVVLTDPAGLVLWVNEGFSRMTGFTLAEMRLQKPGHLLQGPGTDPRTVELIRTHIAHRKSVNTEIVNHRKDGTPYWSAIEIQPMFDAAGNLTNWMSVQRDITSLRNAEQALRQQAATLESSVAARTRELESSRHQFQDLIELAPDALLIANAQGTILLVNREAERLFGWNRAELIGQPVEKLIPANLHQAHVHARQAYAASGHPWDQAHRGPLRALRMDGTEFPAEISLGRLVTESGPVITAVVRDISSRLQAEQAIRDTESLYRAAISAADAVAYARDHGTNSYAFMGAGIEKLTGYSPAEMTPELWHRIGLRSIMQGDAAGLSVEEAIRRAKAGSLAHWRCDTLIRHRDGSERWIAESAVEVHATPNRTPGSVGILIDITERKQSEEALRRSEASLKQAQHLAHLGSWQFDLTNRTLEWSEEVFRIFGLNPATTRPSYELFFEAVHPEDRARVEQAYSKSVAEHTQLSVIHRILGPGGSIRIVQQFGRTEYDGQGTPIRSYGTVQDITELKQIEGRLRESQALLQQVTESIEEAFWLFDHAEQRVVFVSPGYERLWGRTGDALYSDPTEYLAGIHPEDRPAALQAMERQARGEPTVLEYRVVTPDGILRWILDRSFPVLDANGKPFRTAGVARDITQRRQAEEDLRIFRTIADDANYGVVIASLNGHIHYVNETWAREHGWNRADILGRKLDMFHAPEELPRVKELVRRILEEGGFNAQEVWHCRQDGSTYPTLMTASRVLDGRGKPMFMTATAINISDRVLGQRRLQLRNEVLRRIAENAQIIEILEYLCRQVEAMHQGCFCHVMQAGSDHKLHLYVAPSIPPEFRAALEPLPIAPNVCSCTTAILSRASSFSADTANDPTWANAGDLVRQFGIRACWSTPILDGQDLFGTFALTFNAPRAASELDRGFVEECARLAGLALQHHSIQHALMESSAHFRTLADSGQALVWTADTTRGCNYVNKVWLEFTGRSLEQERGDGWLESLHPEDRPRITRELLGAFERRERGTFLFRLRRHDGEFRSIEAFATPRLSVRGDFIGFICHCLDVTDRLAAQRQLNRSQRLEAIGQLAGGIAHDLNNALAPILMTSTLLRLDHPGAGDLIDTVESSARRCADMVKQLVTFAKGAEGKRHPLDSAEVLHGIERIIRSTFPKNIELRVFTPEAPWRVLGDPTQLHQVLLNLCVNARDAMPHGGPLTLRLSNVFVDETFALTTPEARPGRYLLMEVEDTGSGIPPEIIDRIFEPFFTTKDPDRGTGLGLSTVVGIVKGHGGFIRVYSQVGHGSRFHIYLPALAADVPCSTPTGPDQPRKVDGQGQFVLVVDDDPSVRQALSTVLASLSFKVLTAADGAEALVTAAERRSEIRVVITDVHMPHLGGIQLVQALHRMLPSLPVIITSGRLDDHEERQFKELGVAAILPKPFTQEALVAALGAAFLGRSKALQG